jgi:hypothetical protein
MPLRCDVDAAPDACRPMIDKPPERFLMTPAQHRQWVPNARRRNRPDLAQHHEKLARAIEIAGWPTVALVDNPPRPDCQPAG